MTNPEAAELIACLHDKVSLGAYVLHNKEREAIRLALTAFHDLAALRALQQALTNLNIKLDAIQPDPSLAVLTTSECEQALEKAEAAGIEWAVEGEGSQYKPLLAEARRLLNLPEVK